jgi:hypothetical protein
MRYKINELTHSVKHLTCIDSTQNNAKCFIYIIYKYPNRNCDIIKMRPHTSVIIDTVHVEAQFHPGPFSQFWTKYSFRLKD